MVAAFIDDEIDVDFVEGELQKLLPYSKVVEVINNVDPTEIFVGGKDKEAVQSIATILGIAGYLPIIKGRAYLQRIENWLFYELGRNTKRRRL